MARKAGNRKAEKSSAPRKRAARRAAGGGGSDERSDYRQKIRDQKMEQANKKGGCVPKLFMLLLPFVGLGAYLILRA